MLVLKISERNFIKEMKNGNEQALEYVIDNYAWILKTVLKKHLFNIMHAYDECMNDCLLAIWDNIDNYNPDKSSFKNWVGGIAKYKSIDYTRKYLKDLENKDVEDIIIPVKDDSLKEILEVEVREETEKMLSSLSEQDKIIFKKLYFQDEDIEEISNATGLSKSVLYNRISRGKKKIRRNLNIEGGYENEKL